MKLRPLIYGLPLILESISCASAPVSVRKIQPGDIPLTPEYVAENQSTERTMRDLVAIYSGDLERNVDEHLNASIVFHAGTISANYNSPEYRAMMNQVCRDADLGYQRYGSHDGRITSREAFDLRRRIHRDILEEWRKQK